MSELIKKQKKLDFIMTSLPSCSKCGGRTKLENRTITCGFKDFISVIDLVCMECFHKEENIFDIRC